MRRVKGTQNCILKGSKIVKRLRRRHFDTLIIKRTIGLVLVPSTTFYKPFLKHCTLTNMAAGTICRTLSKSHQKRQSPDFRPLLFVDGRITVCPIRMSLFIFLINNIHYLCCLCRSGSRNFRQGVKLPKNFDMHKKKKIIMKIKKGGTRGFGIYSARIQVNLFQIQFVPNQFVPILVSSFQL